MMPALLISTFRYHFRVLRASRLPVATENRPILDVAAKPICPPRINVTEAATIRRAFGQRLPPVRVSERSCFIDASYWQPAKTLALCL